MLSKISNWFDKQDEKFISILKDNIQREKYLRQLSKYRAVCLFMMFGIIFFILVLAVFMKFDEINPVSIVLPIVLLLGQIIVFLDTESKIMTIRLYELLNEQITFS